MQVKTVEFSITCSNTLIDKLNGNPDGHQSPPLDNSRLEAMPDDGGWKHYEIIDGELFVTCVPTFAIKTQVATSILNWEVGPDKPRLANHFKPLV